jgi:tetratricopeptide (TPR) repeat protein
MIRFWWQPQLWIADKIGRLRHWYGSEGRLAVVLLAGALAIVYFHLWTVLVIYLLGLLTLWAWRARRHIVIEEVADRTRGAPITDGAATLLSVELARIHDVFRIVDERNALPTSVGEGRPLEAAVKVDDVSEVLRSPVSAESKLSIGPIVIPLGTAMALLGRIVQGPRLRSELHEKKGGLVLTAQLTGFRRNGTWRIEREIPGEMARSERLSALHEMVEELGCRMFTNLGVPRKVKWRAMQRFLEALRIFRSCLRTPLDRGFNLKEAEDRLLAALAEDEDFALIYYNLGVVYSELRRVAQEEGDHEEAERHLEAAEAAFGSAIERDPSRWDAYYALARMEIARTGPLSLMARERARELCERVVTMPGRFARAADRAKAHDLIAFTRDAQDGLDHRHAAARLSLRALRAAMLRPRSRGAEDDPVPGLTDLAANCLVNLARGESEVRDKSRRGLAYRRLLALFALAERLTTKEGRLHFELGLTAEDWHDYDRAVEELTKAVRIEPGRALYWAHLSYALMNRALRVAGGASVSMGRESLQ